MSSEDLSRQKLAALAAECLLALENPDEEPERRQRWQRWLDERPAHRDAVERYRAIWHADAGPNENLPWPTDEELNADSYDGDAPIEPPISTKRISPNLWPIAAAITMIAAAAVLLSSLRLAERPSPQLYQTGRAEERSIALQDGSSIKLGPETEVEISIRPDRRQATLRRGAALITVAHEAERPFLMAAGGSVVEDVGTAFSVRMNSEGVTLAVIDGAVMLMPNTDLNQIAGGSAKAIRLVKGEQITFGKDVGPIATVDPSIAAGWAYGELAYVDRPLSAVVADLRPFTTRDIILTDSSVGSLRFTGTILSSRIESWARGLPHAYPISVVIDDQRITLAPANCTDK